MIGPAPAYDAIVVGGGINGLTAATYLQRSGLQVACFERKLEAGAGCCTEEVMAPGVKVNLCACNLVTLWSPAYGDLELERFGLEMRTSGPWGMFHPFPDGSAVKFHSFSARSQYEHWAAIDRHDAEVFATAYDALAEPLAAEVHASQFTAPNQGPDDLVRPGGLINMLRLLIPQMPEHPEELTGVEIAEAVYGDERIRTAVLTNCVMVGSHPWERGLNAIMPIVFPVLQCVESVTWTARGGSHAGHPRLVLGVHGGRRSSLHGLPGNPHPHGRRGSRRSCPLRARDLSRRRGAGPSGGHLQPVVPPHLPRPGRRGAPARLGTRRGDGLQERRGGHVLHHMGARPAPTWPGHPDLDTAYGFNYGVDGVEDIVRLQHCLEHDILPDPPIVAGLSVQGFALAPTRPRPRPAATR